MSGILDFIIGKRLTPEEQVKKWRQSLRGQERELEKQIRGIESEETKAKRSLKQVAAKGDKVSSRLLCKEIVKTRKAKEKIFVAKAQLNSVGMQLQHQLATMKVAGHLQKSTEVMKLVNGLVKLPQISQTMQDLQKEMMKAGIIEEMLEDVMDMDDVDDIEEEAEEEVEKVLFELTNGLLGEAKVTNTELPGMEEEPVQAQVEEDLDDMKARLEALKS